MARFNEILVGRYNRFVQKFLSMKGPANMPTLNPDLGMMLSLFHGAENRYLEAWDLFGVSNNNASFAANASAASIRNPVGSNTIATLTHCIVSEGAADEFRINVYRSGMTDQTNVRTTVGWDNRGRVASTCIVSDSSGVAFVAQAGGIRIVDVNVALNTGIDLLFGDEIPIPPGGGVLMVTANAAVSPTWAFRWRERALEDSERA